jgi:hypothetical protein
MGEIKQILRKKRRFYLFSKVILAVSKVRHLPQLPPLRYGHALFETEMTTLSQDVAYTNRRPSRLS